MPVAKKVSTVPPKTASKKTGTKKRVTVQQSMTSNSLFAGKITKANDLLSVAKLM
ncbi:hypothetical protein [Sediminibacterium sp.]|uniref:hypothetical protein n=1 Tax=Sediminibacterium sp. TaxID=1917865 RepID=UPI0025D4D51C|nr:hypothetical protein [Sediminibacterium sp.]MDO9156457.1 hypothetical protein [Sediminibacterium sp.]MDP1973472.1 hypothetical protein [Sediminibacterium sp.]MDP2422025.1 hypothetical protein [Sediminibacterium sp.]